MEGPQRPWLRRLEHAVALYALYRCVVKVHRLGAAGIKKAIVGVTLSGARRVPLLASKVKAEEDVGV